MNSKINDVVSTVFQPAVDVTEVAPSTVAIATSLKKVFKVRFEKGLEARKKMKSDLDAIEAGTKQDNLAKRIMAKDMELEVLRNFYNLCKKAEEELEARLPQGSKVEVDSIGDVEALEIEAD